MQYLSFTVSLHWVWQSLGPSMLLQMALFHSFFFSGWVILGFPGGSIVKTLSNIYGWIILGFPGGSVVKNVPDNAGDMGLIPRLGRYLGDGNGNPFQYSCLGNLMERRVGVSKESEMT